MVTMGAAYEQFRPRRARAVAWTFVAIVLVATIALALVMSLLGPGAWGAQDTALLALLGVVLAYGISRFASIRADPTPEGMTVRNILVTTRLRWSEVERVRFGANDPWAYLVLVRGEDLPVMAIQRSDGALAQRQAGRLAALVQAHGGAGQSHGPGGDRSGAR